MCVVAAQFTLGHITLDNLMSPNHRSSIPPVLAMPHVLFINPLACLTLSNKEKCPTLVLMSLFYLIAELYSSNESVFFNCNYPTNVILVLFFIIHYLITKKFLKLRGNCTDKLVKAKWKPSVSPLLQKQHQTSRNKNHLTARAQPIRDFLGLMPSDFRKILISVISAGIAYILNQLMWLSNTCNKDIMEAGYLTFLKKTVLNISALNSKHLLVI